MRRLRKFLIGLVLLLAFVVSVSIPLISITDLSSYLGVRVSSFSIPSAISETISEINIFPTVILKVVILGFLIILALVVLFGLFGLLAKIWSRAEWLRGFIPPLFFLCIIVALPIDIIISVISWGQSALGQGSVTGFTAIIITLGVAFGLPFLFPTIWKETERQWWRVLGGSPVAHNLRDWALEDFESSIDEWVTDEKQQRAVAFLLALIHRLIEFPDLHRDLKSEKDEQEKQLFKSTVDNLNEGWRSGLPPRILGQYIEFIERTSAGIEDNRERLRGGCTVANVRSLSGNLEQAHKLAEGNWQKAKEEDDLILKWMASYAYFNTISFRGDFRRGMILMACLWLKCYEGRDQEIKEATRQLSNMMVNPVLATPRLLILAAAFNGSPIQRAAPRGSTHKKQYWPWPAEASKRLGPDDLRDELTWVECWYEKAKEIGMVHFRPLMC